MSEIKSSATLQLDTGTAPKDLEKIQGIADSITTRISKLFGNLLDEVKELKVSFEDLNEPIREISNGLKTMSEWNVGSVITGISNISLALEELNEQLAAQQTQDLWTSFLSPIATALQTAQSAHAQEINRKKGKYESGKTLFGGSSGENMSSAGLGEDNSAINGFVSGGAMELGSLFPDLQSITEMKEAMSDLVGTIKESVTQWGKQVIVKAKSRAEDLKIIAVNAVEHVKAFGLIIGQLVASAAAWVSETAAKVANTVATWAQVAATTAWQGICIAATAVTTAFGAAMTFLTSPIGLVVIAIAALIAIVVLLVTNWDTVKAAVLTAWEAIKGALATAAEWLNTNLLQPVIGFFTSAMDWISEKVQAGFAFVQSIFAKVGEFLQGAFAKDWTEQFGAFGNVLNAFFANVQNIWNAIKSIFSGIVSFVKNVFAGDWGAAWDSIVSVFKGIWDYLVAVVKAPINGIIGLINGLVEGVVDGINLVIRALNSVSFEIPDWVPIVGGETFGFNLQPLTAPKIPLLAQGAVLPANKPFLAVVGDQKHGTNVEAPLDTIKQAVAEVMAGQGSGDVVINFTGDLAQLARVLKPVIDRENRRVGGSLAKGVV